MCVDSSCPAEDAIGQSAALLVSGCLAFTTTLAAAQFELAGMSEVAT
jgi:hypothetical protein